MVKILLKLDEVVEVIGMSKTTIRRHMESGKFPPPVKIDGLVFWRRVDLEEWAAKLTPAQFETQPVPSKQKSKPGRPRLAH